jgi:formylglycine-generating enzyme required for sulfatase activity
LTKPKETIMKTLNSCLSCGALVLLHFATAASAQNPPSLELRLFAGVNITGTTGSVYVVQSTADVSQSNSWMSLTFLQLSTTNHLFVDTSAPAQGHRFYRALLQVPPPNMAFIRPNTFVMGSPTNEAGRSLDEGPQTTVTLSHGFWIGRHEVTQGEYLAVVGSNPSQFTGDLNRPVETVSWPDATNYCALLTARNLAAELIPTGSRYRLPTEAEWEYAARAGASTRFSYGDDPGGAGLGNYAWYAVNSGIMTHPVEQRAPNPWGLYDMAGNIWEWCQDWQGAYPGGFVTDPQGPASNPIGSKIIRGGAWEEFENNCRSAARMGFGVSPFLKDYILGFRVVLACP